MGERDWGEGKRTVFTRLFESAFKRRDVPEDEMGADIHPIDKVNKGLDSDDQARVPSKSVAPPRL
jgi:hypothetical protein